MVSSQKYLQPYADAVRERMEKIEPESRPSKAHPRRLTSSPSQILVLNVWNSSTKLVATSLAGVQVWSSDCGSLLQENHVSCNASQLMTFLQSNNLITCTRCEVFAKDVLVQGSDKIEDINGVTIHAIQEEPTVFVSVDNPQAFRDARLGEGEKKFDVSPQIYSIIQAVQEEHRGITNSLGSERRQYLHWLVYHKDSVKMADINRNPFTAAGIFPSRPCWALPERTQRFGGPTSDIWKASLLIAGVKHRLDEHARLHRDRPIPRYQMIVDPNKFIRSARHGVASDKVWIPCEFDVNENGIPHLVGGGRSHAFPKLAEDVATPVFRAALPLLAKLDRPRLLLDERRLQVVFKAQRIIVPPKVSDSSDSEYVGLWHMDGMLEHVAAVVLYYYHVDTNLKGGDIEFCGREPADVLGWGDCSNNYRRFSKDTIRAAYEQGRGFHFCRVHVGEGTLLVFSNYQFVHRVLRMINESTVAEASRDFVALFVLDPSVQPLVPARVHLSKPFMIYRTLKGVTIFPESGAKRIIVRVLEFLGVLLSGKQIAGERKALLQKQLQPQGMLACGGNLYSTGNGCYTMIGWINEMLNPSIDCDPFYSIEDADVNAWNRFVALNAAPQQLHRGASEILSKDTDEVNLLVEDIRCNLKYGSQEELCQ